jgi:translocator protein
MMGLIVFMLGCGAAAIPGFVFRPDVWYRKLKKPSWRPPDWLFGPVWLVLYISIAVSGWLVWRQAGFDGAALALSVYVLQLLLNGLWSVAFFGVRRPDLALLEILCLWLSIIATIALFHQIQSTAAYVLIPYVLWVTFAVALNFSIWRLNPARSP